MKQRVIEILSDPNSKPFLRALVPVVAALRKSGMSLEEAIPQGMRDVMQRQAEDINALLLEAAMAVAEREK